MAENTVWTFQDTTEHLLDLFNRGRSDRYLRQAKRAVLEAYRDLYYKRRWTYGYQVIKITTSAEQTDGTITYDHTGGTNERELTLSGATWPSDADLGWVRINQVHYEIDSRVSNTVLTLSVNSNPGADIAAGTAYTWYRDAYPLPITVAKVGQVTDITAVNRIVDYVPPSEFLERIRGYVQTSWPYFYTFTRDENYVGQRAIRLGPPPNTSRTYNAMAILRGCPLNTELYDTGTIDTSGTTVTGTGTAFRADMVGDILRVGIDRTAAPTSIVGSFTSATSHLDNQFEDQRIITEFTSATSIEINEALTSPDATGGTTKYTISSPIDVEEGPMMSGFLMLAEAKFARLIESKEWKDREARAVQAIREAAAYDQPHAHPNEGGAQVGSRLRDIAQSIDLSIS